MADEIADELADRREPLAIRTTRGCCAGVFTSAAGAGAGAGAGAALLTSEDDDLSLLGGRLVDVFLCSDGRGWGWAAWEVDLLFIWLRLLGVVLSRTTRFRTGLLSRLCPAGDNADELARVCLVSRGCELPDRRLLLSSCGPDAEDDNALRRLVRGAEVGALAASCCAACASCASCASFGAPSSSSALVRALSFMGTGISSSELSFMAEYCCWELADWPGFDSRFLSDRDGGRRRACCL